MKYRQRHLHVSLWLKLFMMAACVLPIHVSANRQEASPTQNTLRQLAVIFVDSKDRSVDDVTEREIQVFEDGVPQKASLNRQPLPARYALVIDNSGSLRSFFPKVLETARAIVGNNQPDDETALVSFVDSSHISTVQQFTPDIPQLYSKIAALRVEGGQTALFDAIYLSAELVANQGNVDQSLKKRNALVVITDGENRSSNYSRDHLLRVLKAKGIKLFFVGFIGELDTEGGFTRKPPRAAAKQLLEELAKITAGRAFFPESPQDLKKAISEITHDLHVSYLLTYPRAAIPGSKTHHKVEIKVTNSADRKKRRAIFYPGFDLQSAGSEP